MAKRALQMSQFDQENLHIKVQEWKKANPNSSFYFRPYHSPQEDGRSQSPPCTPSEEDTEDKYHDMHAEKTLLCAPGLMAKRSTYPLWQYNDPDGCNIQNHTI